jgi:DNA polymerase epsilon subunit 1
MTMLTLCYRPQAEVFENFLHGETLEECYQAVADIGNRWLDMLEVTKS